MDEKQVIKLLDKHIDLVLQKYHVKMPFHLDELMQIKEFNRPYFNVFEAGPIKIECNSDGQCHYIEYNDKKYYNYKEFRSTIL